MTEVERGHRVYIAEGCINCHSQYVRPHSADVLLWGPAQDVEAVRRQKPPLIGNRRQGPDLSQVGARRSPLWLRMHFMDPRDVSYESIMPSFSFLFRDERGDALIAYALSLKTPDSAQHLRDEIATWHPSFDPDRPMPDGSELFDHYCATCHRANGRARMKWSGSFKRLPPDLALQPLDLPGLPTDPAQRELRLDRLIKFGEPGTDMPGHEYLPDSDIEALADYVNRLQSAAQNRNNGATPEE
jgi:cytochrome c oxidase cbb3-type subunit 2